jgi:hypothetical protein
MNFNQSLWDLDDALEKDEEMLKKLEQKKNPGSMDLENGGLPSVVDIEQ